MEENNNQEYEKDEESFTWGAGYQKSEALILAEKIYACKNEKKDLEWQLSSEEFHFKYIPVRKKRVEGQVVSRIKYIVPLSIMLGGCLAFLILSSIEMKELRSSGAAETLEGAQDMGMDGVSLLFVLLFLVFGGYVFFKLFLIPEIRQLKLLWDSRNTEKAMQKAKLNGLDTFQKDYDDSKRKIDYMKERIEQLTREIEELTQKQEEMLYHKQQAEERLRREGVLFDVKPDETKNTGKFTLKEEDSSTADAAILYEYYQREEQYYSQYLMVLDARISQVNKELVGIEDEFEQTKKLLMFFGIGYVLLILVQQAFTGVLAAVTSILCIIVSVIVLIQLERRCAPAIIRYLVEEEKEFLSEYAFIHNMVPVKYRRMELLEEKKKCEDTIKDLKKQRENLQFS